MRWLGVLLSGIVDCMTNIAVLGGGQIGEALVSGLIASDYDPKSITVTNRSADKSKYFQDNYGVNTTSDNDAAIYDAGYAFLCDLPSHRLALPAGVSETLQARGDKTVAVSMAAGLTLEAMEKAAGNGVPVVRVMPNTPMLVGKGTNAAAPGTSVSDEQMSGVSELLEAVGEVVIVEESNMDAVTAMSGSSPAYYFLVTEALIDAGVQLGLKRDVAEKLATNAAHGAGKMLTDSGRDPATLRQNVSSPGGTTVHALRELEESGLRGMFFRAAEACANRSNELG